MIYCRSSTVHPDSAVMRCCAGSASAEYVSNPMETRATVDHADRTAPTGLHELDRTASPEISTSSTTAGIGDTPE